jgi:3-oxoacyl-[acyl-carrier-protein] synthase-3
MIESLHVGIPSHIVPRKPSPELERFERVTGIKKTRHWHGSTLGMIYALLAKIDVPKDLDNVLVVTQSPDRLSPCMAVSVHHHLGLDPAIACYDVNRACDGWVFGLNLCANRGRTLLICADRLHYAPNAIEALIFSDSVSATIITSYDEDYNVVTYTDGSRAKELYAGLDGSMLMDGDAVFDFVTSKIPELINEMPRRHWLAPHQANLSMLKILETRGGYRGHTLYSIEEYGNQSMNSIPTCIAVNEQKVCGDDILLCGFGAGFTATLCGVEWPERGIAKLVSL